jgi:hypothetical protein
MHAAVRDLLGVRARAGEAPGRGISATSRQPAARPRPRRARAAVKRAQACCPRQGAAGRRSTASGRPAPSPPRLHHASAWRPPAGSRPPPAPPPPVPSPACPQEPMLGSFAFQSGKQERVHNVHNGRCTAHMFIMHVAEELSSWPESRERQRAWVGGCAALALPARAACGCPGARPPLPGGWTRPSSGADPPPVQQQPQSRAAAALARRCRWARPTRSAATSGCATRCTPGSRARAGPTSWRARCW